MIAAIRFFGILVLIALSSSAQAESSMHFQFDGQVAHDQNFTHELPKGLYFHLIPVKDDGWEIEITKHSASVRSDENFAGITPPLHGPNPTQISGWDFRNENDTRANTGSVNAPQEKHAFMFSLSDEDNKSVWLDINCATKAEKEDVCQRPRDFPKRLGYATLPITSYKLGNPVSRKQIWFEQMSFTVSGDYEAPRKEF